MNDEGIGGLPKHPNYNAIQRLKYLSDDIQRAMKCVLDIYKYCNEEDDCQLPIGVSSLIPCDKFRGIIYGTVKSSLIILNSIKSHVLDYDCQLIHDFSKEYEKIEVVSAPVPD